MLITITLFGCDTKKGDTNTIFNGTEQNLPEEIKGLKLYWVSTGNGALSSGIYVGYLEGYNTTSLNYQSGKTYTSVVLVTKNDVKTILVKEILVENDSIIVIKKLKK